MPIDEGIQPGPPPAKSAPKKREADEPLRHPTPRSPFPLTAVLVVAIGILVLLLVFSVGFNVWFIMRSEHRFGRNPEVIRTEGARAQAGGPPRTARR